MIEPSMDEIRTFTSEQLDAMVAEHVMGWRTLHQHEPLWWCDKTDAFKELICTYHPSRDMTQAMAALRTTEYGFILQRSLERPVDLPDGTILDPERCLLHDSRNRTVANTTDRTLELAICRAMLLANLVEKEASDEPRKT